MGFVKLDGIKIKKLQEIDVIGGNVIKGIKSNDLNFNGFGELYFSLIEKNFIKAWKKHNKMTMNLVVLKGIVKFVFSIDGKSEFREEIIDQNNLSIITIPPKIWFGFKGMSSNTNMLMNFSNIEHDPDEVDRLEKNLFNYDW